MELQRLDRQTRALGLDAILKLNNSKCLIVNLGGLGVEIAKSVILMGMRSVHIFETKSCVTYSDLSTQFFCNESDVESSVSRADASLRALKTLNPYCDVQIVSGTYENSSGWEYDLQQAVPNYNIVVFTDFLLHDLIEWNAFCRSKGVAFISCETRGVFGSIFNDFGDNFTVHDMNGVNPQSGLIINLEMDEEGNGVIDFHDEENEKALKLYTGDRVRISNVDGLEELNGQVREIERTEMWKFKIGKIDNLPGVYRGGGYFEEVKATQTLHFKSLSEYDKNVGSNSSIDYDSGKLDYPVQLEIAMKALKQFVTLKSGSKDSHVHSLEEIANSLPQSYNEDDASLLVRIAEEISQNSSIEINTHLVKMLSFVSRGQLNPVVTFIGGVVGQEIQKAVTGKYNPIFQSFHWECIDALPNPLPLPQDCVPQGSRYDGQLMVFGSQFQRKIGNLTYFMVGAGALGCEFLKNFALMGVGCGPKGKIIVTDMDTIEVSNLSRQFLFNESNVGQMKSTCACAAAQKMNPNLNCEALSDRVETEEVFNERFWQSLSGVVTALDNVAARKYVDEKCIQYRKPMIDSGTLGPSSHVQVVSPLARTESYQSKKEPETIEFAFCTIHFHPNIIEHTITWAKNYFAGVFTSGVKEANAFLKNPDSYLESEEKGHNLMNLETTYSYLIGDRPSNFYDCIVWARQQYDSLFNYGIQNILLTYPPDKKTSSGALFWSGSKRCPTPVEFSPNDSMSQMFIEAASRLYASIFNIPITDANWGEVAANAPLRPYTPNPVKDDSKEKDEETLKQEREQQAILGKKHNERVQYLRDVLAQFSGDKTPLNSVEFEKDDDTNFHIEFITSASNLRARAYRIPEADTHKTKGIAGNIIPAMITTTALTTGLVCVELYKIIQEKDIHALRDAFINLGFPSFQQWEPKEASAQYADRFTLWDQFVVNEGKDITLGECIDIIRTNFKIDPLAFTYYGNLIWAVFMDQKQKDLILSTPLAKHIQKLQRSKFPSSQSSIRLSITGFDLCNPDGNICEVLPPVIYYFREEKVVDSRARAQKLASLRKKRTFSEL